MPAITRHDRRHPGRTGPVEAEGRQQWNASVIQPASWSGRSSSRWRPSALPADRRRPGDARTNHRPGHRRHEGGDSRGDRDGHGPGQEHDGHRDRRTSRACSRPTSSCRAPTRSRSS
ncbi:MAG: hypothetical protein MZW92_42325 [Comamonadaceae bacterium]|nr:hypothetical protein [Comamonadaceae bacterium]